MAVLDELRGACAGIAANARFVRVDRTALGRYAVPVPRMEIDPDAHYLAGDAEARAAFLLTLGAINFGSGWWPTIRKRPGLSGYFTMATALKERFRRDGPWRPAELAAIRAEELASVLGQDADHELMRLYARSLRDLGGRVGRGFLAVVEDARSAEGLVERLAAWPSFEDVSVYEGRRVPFCKRAQLAAADLALARVAPYGDLDRLTVFADNVVPHVLRVDGVLRYAPDLAGRIDRGELLEHGSPEEVEIRACAVHAVELLAAATGAGARELDYALWHRGHEARYRASPSHRSRCTAY